MTVVVGTAGHIDHGKTTLLRALTGIDADRLPEERARGMTIDVGYAHLALDDGRSLDFVDVPGHARLIGNMLVGVGEIDAPLLVIAADDGPRAQTLEHLALLDAMEFLHGIAVVTKIDLVAPERVSAVVAEVDALLGRTSLAGSPVIAVSGSTGDGVAALRAALDRLVERLRDVGSPADHGSRLAIDRMFVVKGRGPVVTGTLRGRALTAGATFRLVPGDASARARGLQVHGVAVDRAEPGRLAINVAGPDASDLYRGRVLTDDPHVIASDRWLVSLSAPLADRSRVRLHGGTAAVDASIGRSGRDAIDLTDGRAAAIVRLTAPVAVSAGDRFVLRRASGEIRVTGGLVLDPSPPRGLSRRRGSRDRVERLAIAVHSGDRGEVRSARLDLHGYLAAGRDEAPRVLASDVEATVQESIIAKASGARISLTDARTLAAASLRRQVSIDRTAAGVVGSAVIDAMLVGGRLVREGTTVATPAAALAGTAAADPSLVAAMDRLVEALDTTAPPPLRAAAVAAGCPPDAIRELERSERIVVLEPDLAYAVDAYRGLAEMAVSMAAAEPLTPAAFRDATGTSRRYVMALLADLDRRAILQRTPAGHVPGTRSATAMAVRSVR